MPTPGWYQYSTATGSLRTLTLRGVMKSGALVPATLKQVLTGGGPPPPPPPPPATGTIRYGLGGGYTSGATTAQNITDLTARYGLLYWTQSTQWDWAEPTRAAFPSGSDFTIAYYGTTAAQADAMFATFPKTYPGIVIMSYMQEPENNAGVTAASWVATTKILYAAIDRARAAGKTYLRKGSQLMAQTVKQGLLPTWTAPGCEWPTFSVYAQYKIVTDTASGQQYQHWGNDPVVLPQKIWTAVKALGIAQWSASAWGYAIEDAYWTSTLSQNDRLQWVQQSAASFQNNNCKHAGWFNTRWTNPTGPADYRIQTYQPLWDLWNQLLAAQGQT